VFVSILLLFVVYVICVQEPVLHYHQCKWLKRYVQQFNKRRVIADLGYRLVQWSSTVAL